MSFKKIDKEFCLTDESVNVYGYRLLTSGLQLKRFNPAIGYLMHNREQGVAVRWEDFRIDADRLYAKPVVNTTRFPDLVAEIEAGFYSAASVGKIVALEMDFDEKLMLDGQTGPTVTKWFPRESSIVDIPGNYSALAQLYDESDNILHDLNDRETFKNIKDVTKMNEINFTAEHLVLLDLADNATGNQITTRLKDLVDKAKKADKAESDLADLQAKVAKSEIADIIQKGKEAKKLTNELADKLTRDYEKNPEGLKDLVDSMPAQQLITENLGDNNIPSNLPEKYKGKTFNDLYVSGDLADLKANYPDYYQHLKEKK